MAAPDESPAAPALADEPRPRRFGAEIIVTVVLTEASFASTSIAPIEIFHSAGRLWNLFHGETARPRFKVQVASVDGNRVRTLCDVGLVPCPPAAALGDESG